MQSFWCIRKHIYRCAPNWHFEFIRFCDVCNSATTLILSEIYGLDLLFQVWQICSKMKKWTSLITTIFIYIYILRSGSEIHYVIVLYCKYYHKHRIICQMPIRCIKLFHKCNTNFSPLQVHINIRKGFPYLAKHIECLHRYRETWSTISLKFWSHTRT